MVKFIVKMAGVYKDKIIVNGWKSLLSLLTKTVILFSSKTKFVAEKFIKVQGKVVFLSSLEKTFKEGFIKLQKAFTVTTLVLTNAFKYIVSMPSDMSIKTAVTISLYKTLTSLMESKITIASKVAFNLYLLFFPKTDIGIGVSINNRLLTSQKFINVFDNRTKQTFVMGGMMKVKSNNLPFYLKNLDPIKLKDMDCYTLEELDGGV